jgi:hypothetical protein
MSKIGQEGLTHAKKYGVVDSHFLDEIKTVTDKNTSSVVEWMTTKSIELPEKMARTSTYMSYLHVLEQAKMADPSLFKSNLELFKTAANLTDMSMVDYRPHERARIFNSTGLLGEMSSALQTYKMNQYSQLWAFGKQGAGRSLALMVGAQALVGGMMGMYAMDEVDQLIGLVNSVSDSKIPTVREFAFKHAPDAIAFGGVSAITGLDFSSKFSAANLAPDSPLSLLSPYFEAIGRVAGEGVALAKNPTLTQAAVGAAKTGPAVVKAAADQYLTDDNGMVLDPKNSAGAKVQRDGFDQAARWLGGRSVKEARKIGTDRARDTDSQWYADRRSSTLVKTNQAIAKNPSRLPELMRDYVVKYEGEPTDFMTHVNKTAQNQQIPASVRRQLEAIKKPRKYVREYQ